MIEGRGLKGSCSVPAYALAEEPPQARNVLAIRYGFG